MGTCWAPKHTKQSCGEREERILYLSLTGSWVQQHHEPGDGVEQLPGQISRQISRKHRIWERGERYDRRLSDRNHHPRLRHLLPVPPPLPPHHHPHHLCSIQGPQREPFKLCQPSTKGLQATTSGAPVKCSPSI